MKNCTSSFNLHFSSIIIQTPTFPLKEKAETDHGRSDDNLTWKHAVEEVAIFLWISPYTLSKFSSQTQTLLPDSWRSWSLADSCFSNCSSKVWKTELDKKVTSSVAPPSLPSNESDWWIAQQHFITCCNKLNSSSSSNAPLFICHQFFLTFGGNGLTSEMDNIKEKRDRKHGTFAGLVYDAFG